MYDALGDKPKALSHYERALLLQKQLGDRAGEAATLNNLGLMYDALGDKPKALSYHEQALPLRKRVGDRWGEAVTLNNLGLAHGALGDKPKALSYYEQALAIQKQVSDRAGEAVTLSNIGVVYDALGDESKALSYYEQALPLQKQVGNRSGEGMTLDSMATALAKLGQPIQSISRYREASLCYLARRPPNVSGAAGSLGLAFGVALRSQLWPQATKLLSEFETLKPAEFMLAKWRALLAGQSGAVDAPSRYQELARLATALPEADHARVRTLVKAGELRAMQRPVFIECPGLVIAQVVAGTQAAKLRLQVGDIVLRYQGQCMKEPRQLVEAARKTQLDQAVSLQLVHQDQPQTLTVQGGRIGIATEEF